MLKSLRVQNYRCLRDVTVELEPLTVLIGQNDTGKTTFLDALQKLGQLATHGGRGFASPYDAAELVWRGAEPPTMSWSAEIAPTVRNSLDAEARYEVVVRRSADSGVIALRESAKIGTRHRVGGDAQGTVVGIKALDPGAFGLAAFRRKHGEYEDLANLADALATSPIYRVNPNVLSDTSPLVRDGKPIGVLGADGSGLAAVLDSLLSSRRRQFDLVETALRTAMPFIADLRLSTTDSGGKEVRFGVRDGEIPARLASDGVLVYLAYLTLVHGDDPPAILLVEEPENGIHPRKLPEIVGLLKSLTEPDRGEHRTQVVIATHSPYLLDYVAPESVRVFGRRPNGETAVHRLLDLPRVRERLESGFSVGELWFNVGEEQLLQEAMSADPDRQ